MHQFAALVALQTDAVLELTGLGVFSRERNQPATLAFLRYDIDMPFTRPMAGLTALAGHRCPRVGALPVFTL